MNKIIKNIYCVIKIPCASFGIVNIGLLAALLSPIAIFIFLNPYYDRSEDFIYPIGRGSETFIGENVRIIKQPFFSESNNLARITIQARLSKKNIKLSLIDGGGKTIRNAANARFANNQIIWEFAPIKDSLKQVYTLSIESINNEIGRNISLSLYTGVQKTYSIEIDGEVLDGRSLQFFSKSKFASPIEKMRTFYKRALTYKPAFIRWLFFPTLLIFFALLIAVSRILIFRSKQNPFK